MKLSVVVPCYNAADTVGAQLEALARQRWDQPWEIVVVDNRCTDDSMSIVRQHQKRLPNLRIVDASKRQGQPFALNTGAAAALGESLAFCDADDVVGEGWLCAIGEALQVNDFVACRLEVEKLNPPWALARGRTQSEGLQKIWYPPYLYHAGGGTIAVKRALYEATGGFDETLPILHDTDFCFRLQLAGIELQFVPDAVMHVRYRDTLGGIYRQSRGYAEANVFLSKKYQSSAEPTTGLWRLYARDWIKLLRRIPTLRNHIGQARWMWELGRQVGRLQGAIKHRVPPV